MKNHNSKVFKLSTMQTNIYKNPSWKSTFLNEYTSILTGFFFIFLKKALCFPFS